MIYTSGTTGRPKGVRRNAPTLEEHRKTEAWRCAGLWCQAGRAGPCCPARSITPHPTPSAVRAALLAEVLVLMPRFDAEDLLRLIERAPDRHGASWCRRCSSGCCSSGRGPEPLRPVLLASRHPRRGACPPAVKQADDRLVGPGHPRVLRRHRDRYHHLRHEPGPPAQARHGGRCGARRELRIYDDAGNILPPGQIARSIGRFNGYPEFTCRDAAGQARRGGAGGFITGGDLGYLDEDGYLFVCDRKRDMVISGGVNIYPAEIEAVLHACPALLDCAVFGVPDPEFGEALMAVIEQLPGATLDSSALRQALRASPRRLQGPQAHRGAHRPAARELRQDLQAPAARSLLGERRGRRI